MKTYDFLISGDTAGFDIMYAQALEQRGCSTLVSRHISRIDTSTNLPAEYELDESHLVYFKNPLEWVNLARKARLVLSLSGAVMFNLQPYLWPIRNLLGLPPVIHLPTGSDMSEMLVEKTRRGQHFRQYLKWVNIVGMCNYPQALINAQSLRLKNQVFFYPPYFIKKTPVTLSGHGRLKFLHPANIDMKITKSDAGRIGKGTDKFINAFAKAIENGLDAECYMVFRGPDREIARQMIIEKGLENRIIWLPPLSRKDFFEKISESDVVVDQFEIGAIGGVFMEALGLGKPVITYINTTAFRIAYPELPPCLNAHGEDDIYEQLMKCANREFLRELGEQGNQWANRYHSLENTTNQLLYYFSVLTGKKIFKFENPDPKESGS